MNEFELCRENESLRRRNKELLRRAETAEQAVGAFARGEVDAVMLDASATPLLLHAAQESLRRNEDLLRAIFDGALDAMLLANDDGEYVDANPAACTLFGLSRGQLIGRGILEFAAPGYDGLAVHDAFQELGQMRGQFPLQRADGARRILDYSAVANVAPSLHLSVMRDVTDQVAAEQALRHSEARFRAMIEKSAEVISLTAADGTTRYLTPASASRLLGWAPEDMAARTPRDQVVPEDRLLLETALDRLVKNGDRDMSLEFRVKHNDGSIRWIESTGTNLLDDPDVAAIVGNYRDVTPRKRAEEALLESRDQLEEAQAIAHVGNWTSGLGPDGVIHWSRECYRIFGIPEGTPMTVASFLECIHPDDRERVERVTRDAIENGSPADVEHRVQRPDGRACRVNERGIVERDASGRPLRMYGTLQDITDRHAAVAALRDSEVRYRRIVENTLEGIWIYDAEGVTTFMNTRMADMLGVTVDEALGMSVSAFVSEAESATARGRTERRQQGLSERYRSLLRRKDGTDLWGSFQASPLFDTEGRFEAALVLVTDVSAERRADETRAHLAAIVESSEDAIIGVSPWGAVTSWNHGAEKLYQYRADEVVGQSVFALVPPEDLDGERRILDSVAHGKTVDQYEAKRCRKDGTVVEVAVTASPVRNVEQVVIGISKIVRDLTGRRQAEATLRRTEEQLRHAQKMEAVGRLAGGVAHDFNNILSVILTYSSFAMDALKPGDPLRSDIEAIEAAGNRATELTRQLLAFSRQQVLKPRVVDLDEIVTDMKAMLGRLLGEDIELTTLPTLGLDRVLADPGQLEQVVMNLAVNARDAMPDGGKLTIETANVSCDAEYEANHLGVAAGDYVMLAVSDTGTGMDAATRAHIFEPFFTTKEKGKGTGLGLSTVFGIVEQSGGHVRVYSEPGQGTTFKIYLPRTDRLAESGIPEPLPVVLRGSETVLLVEDEEHVRVVACAILRRNGYHVLECANGGEAFLISKDFPAKIHLLLTDVVMPRMNGRKLVEQLAAQRPEMRVLFVSGYSDEAIVHHGVLDGGVAFLQKPFTPDALLRKVREVLEDRGLRGSAGPPSNKLAS